MLSVETVSRRYSSGFVVWETIGGQVHREDDLPAIEFLSGTKEWYRFNSRHRVNGPARISHLGHTQWYLNNEPITTSERFQTLTGHSDEKMAELLMKYGAIHG